MQRYVKGNLIGSGTYAKVYKAIDTETQMVVALKEIQLNESEGMPSTALREISILKSSFHKNIVKLLQVIHTQDLLTIVFEYMDYDLMKYIQRQNNTYKLIQQLVDGIQYLHSNNIIHRDLKPGNILVSKDGCLKIADFGLARMVSPMDYAYSSEVVTLWYRAPELLMGTSEYLYEIDIWSLGCILYEMIARKPLLEGTNKQSQLNLCRMLDLNCLGKELEGKYSTPLPIIKIIVRSLEFLPKRRINIFEISEIMNKYWDQIS
jgi:serine/threonine protein kinase